MHSKKISAIAKKVSSGLTPSRSNPEFWLNGTVPWLKTEQLGERFIHSTTECITTTALEKTSIKLYPPKTISVAMYGEGKTRGNVSIIQSPMATNQACCNIELDPEVADYEYVYYFLKTQYNELRNLSSGVRKNLNSEDIKNFHIRLPAGLKDQVKISRILSALDNKIDCNNRINDELEAFAKTLYDYWFVQFDFPDEHGNPYKSSGGKMIYNAALKREIPDGWDAVSVSAIAPIKTGKEDASFAEKDGDYHFFTCGEDPLRCNEYVFDGKAVLLAGNGTFSVKKYVGKFNAYQRTYVLIPQDERLFAPLYFVVLDKVKTLTSGSRGSIVKFITKGDIEGIYLPLPKNRDINFAAILSTIFTRTTNLYNENIKLCNLRDWLLPMLMNGQATVE